MSVEKYLKSLRLDRLPHVWCPGCGNGIVLKATVGAIEELELDPNKIAIVSGIGCSSRATGYLNFNTLHTLHGRAIPFATGVKLSRPELTVIVMTGDGDVGAIGGNHLIHAARRNMDITVITFNNNIYGMTGGQCSPTTPENSYATTAPYGNLERPFDLSRLVMTAGAAYVSRATTYHFVLLQNYIKKALSTKGFSFVEAITQCPTYYGKYNRMGTGPDMMEYFKKKAIPLSKYISETEKRENQQKMSISRALEISHADEKDDRIIIGEFQNLSRQGYVEEYLKLIERERVK